MRVQYGEEFQYQQVVVLLCGITCPRVVTRNQDGDIGPPEAFAREAKYFTELKTLNRDVHVVVDMADKTGNLFGQVLYTEKDEQHNLSIQLLRAGLAKVQDWSASYIDGGAAPLREAEKVAKGNRSRVWQSYKAADTGSSNNMSDTISGVVVEVVSGDTVVVFDPAT